MRRHVLADTGPLVAYLNRRDAHHAIARREILQAQPPLLTCEPVFTEAAWLLRATAGGADALAAMLTTGAVKLAFSLGDEHAAVFELMRRYANVPMSLADACLVRMSELHPAADVLTFDSDFLVYRRFGRDPIPTVGG